MGQTNHGAVTFPRVTGALLQDGVGGNRGMVGFPRGAVGAYFPTVIANSLKVRGNRVTVGLNKAKIGKIKGVIVAWVKGISAESEELY